MLPEEPSDTGPGETSTIRRVRSAVGVVALAALWLMAGPAIEWTTGRQFRSIGPLLALVVAGVVVFAWGKDLGFRRSAILMLLIPYWGFYVFVVAIYRLFHLPERY